MKLMTMAPMASAVGLMLLGLPGCTTEAEIRFRNIGKTAAYRSDRCYSFVRADPTFRMIYEKLALPPQRPTDRQLADQGTPTEKEQETILAWMKEIDPCRGIWRRAGNQVSPDVSAVIVRGQRERDAIYRDLVSGKSAWGETNRRIVDQERAYQRDLRKALDRAVSARACRGCR